MGNTGKQQIKLVSVSVYPRSYKDTKYTNNKWNYFQFLFTWPTFSELLLYRPESNDEVSCMDWHTVA